MRSQTGPLFSLPFTVLPTNRYTRFDPQPFRVLLLRRLHLHLPLTARQWPSTRCLLPSSVLLQGFLGEGATRWRLVLFRSVEKQVLVCDSTPW